MIVFTELDYNIKKLTEKIRTRAIKYDGKLPGPVSIDKKYPYSKNDDWTEGFFVGQIWLCYELTKDVFFKEQAIKYSDIMVDRIDKNINLDHHDLGFLFSLSLYPAYLHTGEQRYLDYMIKAADKLISRYHDKGEFIQSWGNYGDPKEYRAIVDSLLNMPLLYKVSELANSEVYKDIADKHVNTILNNHIRDNNTTYHTFYFNPEDGSSDYGETAQGHRADSTWARGQAWGVTGLAYNQSYSDNDLSDLIDGLLEVFVDNFPKDGVVYWDFDFTDEEPSYRDSSSNAIVLCGLLEQREAQSTNKYDDLITKMFDDLQPYVDFSNNDIILDHSAYSVPNNRGCDEGSAWGDYFYMEALVRLKNQGWKKYW